MKSESLKHELTEYLSTLSANSLLLSRLQICTKWGVSRRTVDKVIAELQAEGYVYCLKGSGTYVSPKASLEKKENDDRAVMRHWAVIIPDVRSSVYPKAFEGIYTFAESHDIDLVICNTDDDANKEFAQVQRQIASNIDGLIIVPAITTTENFRNYKYIQKANVPFVFWQRSVDYMLNVPQMLLNGYYGGYIATKHLIDMGYKRIMYLSKRRFRSSMDRYMGYCAALSQAGFAISQELSLLQCDETDLYGFVVEQLSKPNAPDAFVCYVDSIAVDVVKAVKEKGLRVSDDIGIIGFEGTITWLDSMLEFGLTYVDINRYESGYASAKALWELSTEENPKIRTQIFTPTLCVRNSCLGKRGTFE